MSSLKTKYALCTRLGQVDYLEIDLPKPAEGEAVIRLAACGVCGTDALKVYHDGYAKPQKLGHECVGVVEATGASVTNLKEGQRVAFAHHVPDLSSHYSQRGSETVDPLFRQTNLFPGGFSERILLSSLHVTHTTFPLPQQIPDLRGIFIEPLACCIRGLRRLAVCEGDTCLLIGAGAIGLLFVPLLTINGADVIATDIRPERLELAQTWGAKNSLLFEAKDVVAACRSATSGRGVDAAILTVLTQDTLSTALESVRDGGRVLIFGGKPDTTLKVEGWSIFLREINLVTSYSASPADLRMALELIVAQGWPLENLISHQFPLCETHEAIALVKSGKASKVVVVAS